MSLLLKEKYNLKSKIKIWKLNTYSLSPIRWDYSFENSQTLINEFPKEQVLVKTVLNSGHNDLSQDQKYYIEFSDFIFKMNNIKILSQHM